MSKADIIYVLSTYNITYVHIRICMLINFMIDRYSFYVATSWKAFRMFGVNYCLDIFIYLSIPSLLIR